MRYREDEQNGGISSLFLGIIVGMLGTWLWKNRDKFKDKLEDAKEKTRDKIKDTEDDRRNMADLE